MSATDMVEMLAGRVLEPGETTIDLTVLGRDGVTYSGTDTIRVISQAGVDRKR